jgi:glycosyltransferase involved in cell wall biosynthesis
VPLEHVAVPLNHDPAFQPVVSGDAVEAPRSRRFAVVHWGARLHYAAPQALFRANALRILYTDWHSRAVWPSGLLDMGLGLGPGRSLRRALARRIPEEIPSELIRSYPLLDVQQALHQRMDRRTARFARAAAGRRVGSHALGRRLVERDFEGADALYVHACASTEAVKAASARGIFVVVETISMPFNRLLEREEYSRFGHPPPFSESEIYDNIDFFAEELGYADIVLAASNHATEGLLELGVSAAKIAVVPYGYTNNEDARPATPSPGSVVFVGKVGYLKGVPYLAGACRELVRRGMDCDFRVFGSTPHGLAARPEFRGPRYMGHVPRGAIVRELGTADMFVFPTLSDGFGIVLLEAMEAGLPVITTANCADLVEDGVNGFIVPVRDSRAIADRVELLTHDRALRNRLGAAAKVTARQNGIDQYCQRLEEIIGIDRHATARLRDQIKLRERRVSCSSY